eukprot:9264074-Pyramimonas_sp.AAC.2
MAHLALAVERFALLAAHLVELLLELGELLVVFLQRPHLVVHRPHRRLRLLLRHRRRLKQNPENVNTPKMSTPRKRQHPEKIDTPKTSTPRKNQHPENVNTPRKSPP